MSLISPQLAPPALGPSASEARGGLQSLADVSSGRDRMDPPESITQEGGKEGMHQRAK